MKRLIGLLGVMVSVAIGACGGSGGSAAVGQGATINIGVPLALTGPTPSSGSSSSRAMTSGPTGSTTPRAVFWWGQRRKVNLIYRDDQSTPAQTATPGQDLVSAQQVSFLLGTYGTSGTAQEAVVAQKAGLPMVSANGTSEDQIFSKGYDFVFCPAGPAKSYLKGVIDMALTLNPKRPRWPS